MKLSLLALEQCASSGRQHGASPWMIRRWNDGAPRLWRRGRWWLRAAAQDVGRDRRGRWRAVVCGEALAVVIDGDRPVEVGMDFDAAMGIAASLGPGADLEQALAQLHGIIIGHGPRILETADLLQRVQGWGGTPRGGGRDGVARKAGIVAGEKPGQDAGGFRQCARLGQTQFDDQAILEGPEEPLYTTFIWYEIIGCALLT